MRDATAGVLSVIGDDDYPYGVPVSYIYRDGSIYFHCAVTGHKIDAINKSPKVSFCVIDQDVIVAKENTTYYRSVIAFGKARLLEQPEKLEALRYFAEAYNPTHHEERERSLGRDLSPMAMIEIKIEHMTGKEALKLVDQR